MKYQINNNNISKILGEINQVFEKDSELINNMLEIDYQHTRMRVDIKVLNKIIEKFKNEKIGVQEEQRILIHYNGNPYITLNLCVLAILTKTELILDINEHMLGLNTYIIETINNTLTEFKKDKSIYLSRKNDTKKQDIDKIICIDDINQYNKYLREKAENVFFYSFEYVDLYCDTEELSEITELIYKYADINKIPIESYSELSVNYAVQLINKGLGKRIVLITNNEDTKIAFITKVKNKKIYINQNPFTKEIEFIKKEIFKLK